jgi:hypothetical protein
MVRVSLMLKIFVDTSVWRHWFTFVAGKSSTPKLEQHSANFQKIYDLVCNAPTKGHFLHSKCVENELGKKFEKQFTGKVLPFSEEILIPLTRLDGTYSLDGSILLGGKIGGMLRNLSSVDGYDIEANLKLVIEKIKTDKSSYKKVRKKEFDIEHMEAALEAEADLFITDDEISIALLKRASSRFNSNHPINLIYKIAKTPTLALPHLEDLLNHGAAKV